MKRRNKSSGVYAALAPLLEKGATEQELKSARKKYWAEYRKLWRQKSRMITKEVTITFDKSEYKQITDGAIKHHKNRTKFLKLCIFAYLNQTFLLPNEIEVKRLSQTLGMMYFDMQVLMERKELNFDFRTEILQRIEKIEQDVLITLHHPRLLEEYITKVIEENTYSKIELIELINNIKHDDLEKFD